MSSWSPIRLPGESDQEPGRVWFPPGRWVDGWDAETVIEGPTTRRVQAPLDTLPLYVTKGADVLDAIRGALP